MKNCDTSVTLLLRIFTFEYLNLNVVSHFFVDRGSLIFVQSFEPPRMLIHLENADPLCVPCQLMLYH
jgi:hypothetical protein